MTPASSSGIPHAPLQFSDDRSEHLISDRRRPGHGAAYYALLARHAANEQQPGVRPKSPGLRGEALQSALVRHGAMERGRTRRVVPTSSILATRISIVGTRKTHSPERQLGKTVRSGTRIMKLTTKTGTSFSASAEWLPWWARSAAERTHFSMQVKAIGEWRA